MRIASGGHVNTGMAIEKDKKVYEVIENDIVCEIITLRDLEDGKVSTRLYMQVANNYNYTTLTRKQINRLN